MIVADSAATTTEVRRADLRTSSLSPSDGLHLTYPFQRVLIRALTESTAASDSLQSATPSWEGVASGPQVLHFLQDRGPGLQV